MYISVLFYIYDKTERERQCVCLLSFLPKYICLSSALQSTLNKKVQRHLKIICELLLF